MSEWQTYRRGRGGRSRREGMYVTLSGQKPRNKRCYISPEAFQAIGEPSHVEVAYCAEPPSLRIRATDDPEHGLGTRRQKPGSEGTDFSAVGFITAFGIDTGGRRFFTAELVDGALIVDLSGNGDGS